MNDYIGGNQSNNFYISMLQEEERKFVVTHNANIKPVSYFTGRETELKDLRQQIEEKRKSVLVSGMGGIGKTHICRKLFEEYLTKHAENENGLFQHIGYIEYDGDMGSSLQNCLKYKKQEQEEANREAAWKELEYLASDGKLLLFVDNVNKPMWEDLGLKRLNTIPGAIVLTSRQTSFGGEFESYRLGFLSTEECIEIYEKIRFENSGGKVALEEVTDLEYVIEKLAGRHTITVEHLAHLAWTRRWAVKRLRRELEEKGFCLEFHKNGELVNIQKSYEVLYDLSELTEAEQNILEAFSVFPYIPLAAEICNQWLLADAGISEDDDILIGLYQKGWLQFDVGQERYSMHPVFAKFICEKCKPKLEEHREMIEACQKCLKKQNIPYIFQLDINFTWEYKKYIPFAESILEKIDMRKSEEQIKFIDSLGDALFNKTEYEKAGELYNKCLETCKDILGNEHPFTSISYYGLARVYESQREYGKAENLYKKSLQIYEKVLGKEQSDIDIIYTELAEMYMNQGEYRKAEEMYKKGLRICEKVLGKEHLNIARICNELAGMYVIQKKYKKAEKMYKKGLRICEKVSGKELCNTVIIYHNMAGMYANQKEYRKAEEMYNKNLLIREKVLGEEPSMMVITYGRLADVYENLKEYEKAEELYKKVLQIYEKVLGKESLILVLHYYNLADIYCVEEQYESELFYLIKIYKIAVNNYGSSNINAQLAYKRMKEAFTEWNPEGNFEQWLEEKMKVQ